MPHYTSQRIAAKILPYLEKSILGIWWMNINGQKSIQYIMISKGRKANILVRLLLIGFENICIQIIVLFINTV